MCYLFGQQSVVVSCIIFSAIRSVFCPICLVCKLIQQVINNNNVCHFFLICIRFSVANKHCLKPPSRFRHHNTENHYSGQLIKIILSLIFFTENPVFLLNGIVNTCLKSMWCGIFHDHWWKASIKPRLLLSHARYAFCELSLFSV